MEDHKIFGFEDILKLIIKEVINKEHIEMKQSYTGQIYYTEETQTATYRKITNTCRLWRTMYQQDAIDMEYYEMRIFSVRFCTICGRYEQSIEENNDRHQNIHRTNIATGEKEVKFEKMSEKVTWVCRNRECTMHCAAEPGHCHRGVVGKYKILQMQEYKRWRQRQINMSDIKTRIMAKKYLEEMYIKDRNVARRLRAIKENYGGSKSINLSINF
jgi:hypothetical protein